MRPTESIRDEEKTVRSGCPRVSARRRSLSSGGSRPSLGWVVLLASLTVGCSIRSMAVKSLADALAHGGDVYASDEDPELIRDALPFALKTYETLLRETPDHPDLLLASCSGFTQYANAFVEGDALFVEESDWEEAERLEQRAVRLYLRARDYCLRALEGIAPGVGRALQLDPETALTDLGPETQPLLYWSGASWGAAISLALDRPDMVVDLPAVRALMRRALEIDEAWDGGVLHEAMISLEALPEAMGGSPQRARRHFERALELSDGRSAGAYLSVAMSLSVPEGDRGEFEAMLEAALAIDPDARPERRLATILAQRRAAWLLERSDRYFLDDLEDSEEVDR